MKKDGCQLRCVTWNVRSPSLERAMAQGNWLVRVGFDVIILTELRATRAAEYFADLLRPAGFLLDWQCPPGAAYGTLVAVSCESATTLLLEGVADRHRAPVVRAETALGSIVVVGLYVPSRGPRQQRNVAKRRFQQQVTASIGERAAGDDALWVVGGDLNVVERNHKPHHAVFGEWEYEFYDSFAAAGLVDAYRLLNPSAAEYSWIGRAGVGYRFDHFFVSKRHQAAVAVCRYHHVVRESGLSDHSALELMIRRQERE